MDKMNEIAALVREHRKAAGLTQLKLSEIAGVGKTTVFDIEKGKETVRFINILKVLNTFNIELNFKSRLNGDRYEET